MQGETSSSRPQPNGFAMGVVIEGGLALAAVALARLFSVSLRDLLPSEGKPLLCAIVRGLLATLPLLALFGALVNSKWSYMRNMRQQLQLLIDEIFPDRSLAQFAVVAILAGVGEELLFRGTLQSLAVHWTSPILGIAISSLLFGLAHALSKLYFLFAAVVGVFLGWMTFHYNDLVAPMVAHALYDFLAIAYLARRKLPPPAEYM